MFEVLIPFEITATNLNLADTADQVVHTFGDNAGLIRIPKRLLISRRAGDAYTFTKNQLRKLPAHRLGSDKHAGPQDLRDSDAALEFFFTDNDRNTDRRDSSAPAFRVPLAALGLARATADSVVVFPLPNPRGVFKSNAHGKLVARCNVTISGGGGSVIGHFVFDEYPVV